MFHFPIARSVYRDSHSSYMVSLSFFHANYMIGISCFPCKLYDQPIMFPFAIARSVYRASHSSYMVSLSCFPCKLRHQPIMFPFPVARSVRHAAPPSYMASLSCSLPTPVSLNYLDPSHKLGSNLAGKVARRQTGLSLRPDVRSSVLPDHLAQVTLRTVQVIYIKTPGRPQRHCRFLLF